MSKVSDFKFSSIFLKKICQKNGVSFVDCNVLFDDIVDEDAICVGTPKNIAHTIFKIISEYINKSESIVGKNLFRGDKNNFLISLASSLRSFMYSDDFRHIYNTEPHSLRLYQKPIVWILMKNIICPLFDKDLKNIKVVCVDSPYVDISRLIVQEDFEKDIEEPFIFLNNIDNRIIQNAFLLIESIKGHDLSPIEVFKEIYESDLYSSFEGLLDLSLNEEEKKDFESTLMFSTGIDFYSYLPFKYAKNKINMKKISQNVNSQWQNLGVLEQMIEPFRTDDWSVYNDLNPYIEQFWNKVEEVRKKRIKSGHDDGVPFDLLLRIKSKQTTDHKTDVDRTIQDLLSSNRVW